MSYRTKKQKVDIHDNPIVQPFVNGDYDPTQITTEKTQKEILNAIKGLNGGVVREEPPHLSNIKFLQPSSPTVRIRWFYNGYFYGVNNGSSIYKSVDGENWELVTSVPKGDSNPIEIFMISETGRMIAGFFDGQIYVSDEDGNFNEEPTIVTGRLLARRGHFIYRNIIMINTYEAHGMENKHEVFLSTDSGASFNKVFDNSILQGTYSDNRIHLHDVEYDPYSGRLYVWNGDFENRNLWYSDNWGVDWSKVWDDHSPGNATQVLATKNGLMLGSDTDPGGIAYIPINRDREINPMINQDDYDSHFWYFNPKRYIAARRWVDRSAGVYLMPFYSEHDDGMGHLAFSRDGYTWHEIFKTRSIGFHHGFDLVTYGNGKVVARYIEGNESWNFVADINL